jgi:FkbM family methyltransferase
MKEINKSFEIIESPFGNFLINEYDVIGNYLKHTKGWELHLYELYSRMINKDSICIDAGANLGFHTIQFGKLAKRVYAFEPQPLVYNQLCANVLFNGLDDIIEPHRLALGDKDDIKQMWKIENEDFGNGLYNWGGRGIEHEYATHNNTEEIRKFDQVKTITLDSLNLQECDLLKIDIQGYEYYAFLGAENLLATYKPIIFLENSLIKDNKEQVMNEKAKNYLLNLGYELYRFNIGNQDDCVLIHPENKTYVESKNTINTFSVKYNIIKE